MRLRIEIDAAKIVDPQNTRIGVTLTDTRTAEASILIGELLTGHTVPIHEPEHYTHVGAMTVTDGPELREQVRSLEAENERLTAWLQRIDGGDRPCDDAGQLRQWAYQAVTLKHPIPAALDATKPTT